MSKGLITYPNITMGLKGLLKISLFGVFDKRLHMKKLPYKCLYLRKCVRPNLAKSLIFDDFDKPFV